MADFDPLRGSWLVSEVFTRFLNMEHSSVLVRDIGQHDF